MKTDRTRKYLIKAGTGLLAWMLTQPLAAINLSNVPLIASISIDPNIMFMFDTSGSMNHIVADAPYDPSTSYGNCPSSKGLSAGTKYYLSVASDGTARIGGASGASWQANTNNKCFTPTLTYNAALISPSDSGLASSLRYYTHTYSGNYLNWYFSNATQTGPANNLVSVSLSSTTTGVRRSDTKTRMEVAKASLTTLITNSISNAYVGLTVFKFDSSDNSKNGADVLKNLADIDVGSNKSVLLTAVAGLSGYGGTPLSSTLAQLGRYFVKDDRTLTFTTAETTHVSSPQQAHTLFNPAPMSGNPGQEYILKSCQKNFIVAMTDGEPSADSNFNQSLGKWKDGTNSETNDFDDIAGALYDLDLRPDLGKNIKNNITSHMIGFELTSTLLENAAKNGGGLYFTATNSTQLSAAFSDIINDIDAQDGTMSSVAFNSSQLEQNSAIYQAMFNTGNWYGSLNALPLEDNGDIPLDAQGKPVTAWKANVTLDAMTYTNRKIFTYDNTTLKDGIPFAWANLNTNQKNDLRKDGIDSSKNGSVDDTDAQLLLAYISGDRSTEGTASNTYRTRESRLGDIVNSAPIFVSKPQMNWPDYDDNAKFGSSGKPYSSYKNDNTVQARTPVVYVGANDGMLHGFDATIPGTGAEVFAYIPGLVYSDASQKGLHYLASQQYEHLFYVDLTPAVSDVFIKTAPTGSPDWRTVLVGGLQAGGKGLFALDVSKPSLFSNPSNYADDVVLWEFDGSATTTGSADMGHVFGTPTVAMMANGKWAVISPNGYDSSSGLAKLFIIFLEEGLDGAWTVNTDYIALDTGVGTDNGLSTPRAIDFDGDSVVDMIYAGDLKGNMWAFDVSSSSTGSWTKRKLFTAINGDGTAQPITSAPIVALNPNNATTPSASNPNVLVMFGTGQYLVSADNTSKTKMAYYAVWDNGTSALTRSNLAARTQVTTGTTRTISGTAVDWTKEYGWYIDLLNNTTAEGERVVADSLLRRQVLFFNTIIPDADDCKTSGSGWLMSVQYDTGLAPGFGVFDGNNDGLIDSNDIGFVGEKFDEGMPTKSGVLGERQYTPGTKGTIEDRKVNVGPGNREGRLSWHEIFRD